MRVRGLAFVGLVVGAFLSSSSLSSSVVTATAAVSSPHTQSLDRFFSSDGPESLHEANNQGTLDEPKAWPEANAWLHAQLSETEREFLALTTTGTVAPNPNLSGGLTSTQLADNTATITVSLRFNVAPAAFSATQLQTDLVNSLGATTTTVGVANPTSVTVPFTGGSTTETLATFVFSSTVNTPAGTLYTLLTNAFVTSGSSLRATTSFGNIDFSYFPTALYAAGATTSPSTTQAPTTTITATTSTATATTALPTTATATTAAAGSYCSTHATACLNGGTCIAGATSTTYSCACGSTFIGAQCQFSLNPASKRSQVQGGSFPKGKSITRPNVNSFKPRHA